MTRIGLGLAAEDASFLVVGYALLYAVGLARLQARDLRLFGLSYLLGWALLGSALSFAVMAGMGLSVGTFELVAALLVAVCAVVGRRAAGEAKVEVETSRSRHPLGLAAAGVAAAILAVEAGAALIASVKAGWETDLDVLTAWIPRAEVLFYWHHLNPSVWGSFIHPEYPPLIPAIYASTFDFVGGFHPSVLPFQQVLLGIAFLLAVIALLDRYVPPWISLPSLALLMSASWFWWRLQVLLPDQTLAYLIAVAALTSVLWLYERRGAWLVLTLAFLTAASYTKLEGVSFGAVLAVVVLAAGVALHRRQALPAAALLLGPAAIVPWHFWLVHNRIPASNPDYHPTDFFDPGYLNARLSRFTSSLNSLFDSVTGDHLTGAIASAAAVAVVVAALRVPVIAAAVGVWFALLCVGMASIYWIGRVELGWYLYTSATRVGATILVTAATLTPLLLGLALRGPPSRPAVTLSADEGNGPALKSEAA